jgi:hypothetical protein
MTELETGGGRRSARDLITGLHALEGLSASGIFVAERFIRGAPFLAPLLFANMGSLGLFTLLGPEETAAPQP